MLYWLISTLDKTVLDWYNVLYKNETSQGTSIILIFSLLKFIKFDIWEIFSCWSRKEDLHYSVSKHGNKITKVCKITWFLTKKWIKKWRVVVLRISRHFCGWFEKHSMGKHKENLRTVYNLFDHWNMALSSDFRHLKTLLATRLVFHSVLKMAACCSRSVPAATKCCCVKA